MSSAHSNFWENLVDALGGRRHGPFLKIRDPVAMISGVNSHTQEMAEPRAKKEIIQRETYVLRLDWNASLNTSCTLGD
jgi:hypothetical protein